ncbi:MAG: PrsW family intramembrane metalloprotease [Anaerolineales bacterium]|nr:PrsW family intramembrane metalloprotease [Anaerolineales bacterium]
MQTNRNHWPSILILIVFAMGVLTLLSISFVTAIASILDLFNNSEGAASEMIGAFAFGFEMILLLICSWFVLQKAMGRAEADKPFVFPFAKWQIFAIIGIIVLSIAIGGGVAYTEIAWLAWIVLPVLTVLVIVPPLWLLFGLGTKGIELGPRWRVFGIFGLSMTVGPFIMIILEIIVLLGIIVVGSVIVAIAQPALFQELASMGKILEGETNPDRILSMVGPYLTNPIVIATIVGYIAVIVPLIEELLKPLAVWIFATRIQSTAQGFAMGVLSGAGFALLESLNASADGTTGWPVIVSIRAGTSLLHMTASGLVGWGIASAFREKSIVRFFAAYFMSVTIHGIWNACAIGAGISALGESLGRPEWLFNFIPAMVGGMIVLGIGMFIVLIASNRKLTKIPAALPAPQIEKMDEGVQ